MFTLKSLSPSRSSLTIPSPSSRTHPTPTHSAQTSPVASPSSGRSPGAADRISYFSPPSARRQPTREEALRTVRALEEVLGALNEYRLCTSAAGKASKKLGLALRELAGCTDKTEVAAQTLRPTAALLEGISDVTLKLSKKMDKEYDEANSDASKYFTLLAKESRTHDAYLGAIGKKHDKAEKAYRKASKSLSDTSGAHAGLLALKDTLSDDISRAQEDHHSLIGNKQATILLRMASSSGVLAANTISFFSDGLRKAAASYPDIEYFRSLADAKWQSSLPPTLDDEVNEGNRRDELRLIKARVALGESDIVGPGVWERLKDGQDTSRELTPKAAGANLVSPKAVDLASSQEGNVGRHSLDEKPKRAQPSSTPSSPHAPAGGTMTSPPNPHGTRPSLSTHSSQSHMTHASGTSSSTTVSGGPKSSVPGNEISATPASDKAAQMAVKAVSSGLTPLTPTSLPPASGGRPGPPRMHHRESEETEEPDARSNGADQTNVARRSDRVLGDADQPSEPKLSSIPMTRSHRLPQPSQFAAEGVTAVSPPAPSGGRPRPRPPPIPYSGAGGRRSVSQITAEMQARSRPQSPPRHKVLQPHEGYQVAGAEAEGRQRAFDAHRAHERFVRGCELCEIDYERMLDRSGNQYQHQHQPLPQPPGYLANARSTRRVTMPPLSYSMGPDSDSGAAPRGTHRHEVGAGAHRMDAERERDMERRDHQTTYSYSPHGYMGEHDQTQSDGYSFDSRSYTRSHEEVPMYAPRPRRAGTGVSPELEYAG